MATKESIALKLRNLIESGNTTTGKTDENLTDVFRSLIAGYGQGGTDTSDATAMAWHILKGETAYGKDGKTVGTIPTYEGQFTEGATISQCSGEHVISVEALPTENIDKTAIYKLISSFTDVMVYEDGEIISLKEMYEYYGLTMGFYSASTKPVENIMVSNIADNISTSALYFYHIEDENDVFIYGDMEDTGVDSWFTLSEVFGATDMPFRGLITDESQATESGYYAFGGESESAYYGYFDTSIEDMIIHIFGSAISYKIILASEGVAIAFHYATTIPTEDIEVSDTESGPIHIYYIADTNVIGVFNLEYEWEQMGEIQGVITDIAEATEDGLWIVMDRGGWKEYLIPNGVVAIDENGTHNISGKAKVIVDVPVPDGYVIPTGDVALNTNGTYDISGKAKAIVDVSSTVEVVELPTKNIDSNIFYKKEDELYQYCREDRIVDGEVLGCSGTSFPYEYNINSRFIEGQVTFDNSTMTNIPTTTSYYKVLLYEDIQCCAYYSDRVVGYLDIQYGETPNDRVTYGGSTTLEGASADFCVFVNVDDVDASFTVPTAEFYGGGDGYGDPKVYLCLYRTKVDNVLGTWEKYIAPEGEITITENGTYNVVDKAEVVVNVVSVDSIPNAEDNVF